MNIDVLTAVQVGFFLAVLGAILSIILGMQSIRSGLKLHYFRKRRDMIVRGWRLLFTAVIFGVVSFFLNRYAEPAVYLVFPPSPTVTITSTITLTPTITKTATLTVTPSITPTPAQSYTPSIPEDIQAQFTSVVTPNPDAVFSPMLFSLHIDDEKQPLIPSEIFENPIHNVYATFSYDKMLEGSQWTALWYRPDGEVICFESIPWNGSTGGYGSSLCEPAGEEWLPGTYQVQFFVGQTWVVSGEFSLTGDPPLPTSTATVTKTATITWTPSPTKTPQASLTPSPTRTSSVTPGPSPTPTVTRTPTISLTPRPSATREATLTALPSATLLPTRTPRPTDTLWPTEKPDG
jgi:hypothetical protein